MKLLNFTRTYRNLVRIKEILQVLTKHGFGHIVSQLNLTIYIPNLRQLGVLTNIPSYLSQDSAAARLRMVMQELGPTLIKLGQILSGRPDIIPENFIREFKSLQDRVPPFPTSQALQIVAAEFGSPAQEIFPYFEEQVLASGSIGQVHRAKLPNGQKVIVKVKRPGIEDIIATDVAIIRFFAELSEKYIEELRIFQPVMIVEEFWRTIQRELDFTAEAAYTEKFWALLQDNPNVTSPQVYWQHTTSNIITLQRMQGRNIGDFEAIAAAGLDIKVLARNLVTSFMQQYFVWGLFHADPHPGNILFSPSGQIFLIDFGMVGHLSEELKEQLSTTVLALVRNDIETIIQVYSDIGVFTEQVNSRELRSDIIELLDKYFNTPFHHLDLSKVFQDIVRLARHHKVILPRDFVLLGKSLVMVASLAREMDPDFNLAKAATPHVAIILREKFSPRRLAQMSAFQLWTLFSLVQKLPVELKEMLRRIKSGNLCLTVRHESIERYLRDLDRIANRLAVSIVLAAIIIGASLLAMAQVGPKFQEIPILGLIGYIIAGICGLILLIAMLRSGRL